MTFTRGFGWIASAPLKASERRDHYQPILGTNNRVEEGRQLTRQWCPHRRRDEEGTNRVAVYRVVVVCFDSLLSMPLAAC